MNIERPHSNDFSMPSNESCSVKSASKKKRSSGQTDKNSSKKREIILPLDYLPILKPQRKQYNKFKAPE